MRLGDVGDGGSCLCVKARGHLVADVDPLGIVYADLHSAYETRGESPSRVVVRDHMLGNLYTFFLLFFPMAFTLFLENQSFLIQRV